MSDADPTTPCESCRERGKTYAHLNYGAGRGAWEWVDCLACGGSGRLTADQRERIEAGQRLRDRRKAEPWRSLRDEAARLGLGAAELSQAEAGRLPLARILEIEAAGGAP